MAMPLGSQNGVMGFRVLLSLGTLGRGIDTLGDLTWWPDQAMEGLQRFELCSPAQPLPAENSFFFLSFQNMSTKCRNKIYNNCIGFKMNDDIKYKNNIEYKHKIWIPKWDLITLRLGEIDNINYWQEGRKNFNTLLYEVWIATLTLENTLQTSTKVKNVCALWLEIPLSYLFLIKIIYTFE